MATVISNEKVGRHTVDKYSFKVLSVANHEHDEDASSSTISSSRAQREESGMRPAEVDSSAMSQSSKDALIESLMKKTDDMSSNFIKLQMKLEAMEEEHKQEIEKIKEQSFNEGIEAAKVQFTQEGEANASNAMDQFASSVSTLESSAKEYESALEGIKENLITAALDIAKEVVNIELNESAREIAGVLSNELIKELQSASKITLKVNPNDHGFISQKVGSLEHVEVLSDKAVSQGGVIAMSDAGNIDAQISKRFERVKRAALSE